MKICIIKQYYDILGPTSGFVYKEKSINDILNLFNTKLNGFSCVIFGETDYYILNSYNFKRSECELVKDNKLESNYKKIYEATLGTTISEESIPYSDYDIIWCRDPILINIKQYKSMYPNTLFIYEEVEHDRGYCSKTSKYYDLILKHNSLNFNYQLKKLPMEVAFPYPWSVTEIRKNYDLTKNNQLYIDYRDIFIYTINRELDSKLKTYNEDKKTVIDKFENIKEISPYPLICNINNSINGLCISNTGLSDSYNYLYLLAKSKYYSSLKGRVGQALVDAAVMNCICFSVYTQCYMRA